MNWLIVSGPEWTVGIRAELDTALDLAVDYDGTIDAAWTQVGGVVAGRATEYFADGMSAFTLSTAPRQVVVGLALDRGLTPRAATFSTLTVELTTGAGGVLPVGTVLRVNAGTVQREDGATGVMVPFERSQWEVIENLFPSELLAPTNTVVVQCTVDGNVIANNPLDLEPEAAIVGIEILQYNGGVSSFGRAAERTSELRVRVENARANVSGTDPGMITALRDLDWILAAGIVSTAGYIRVTVAPDPPTDALEEELAQTIYSNKAAGAITLGAESRLITAADGQPITISYDVGQTTDVIIVLSVTPAAGVTDEAALTAAKDALLEVFVGLAPGQPLLWVRAYGSLNQASIAGADMTLNGLQVDVVPSPANTLVAVFA